MNELNGILLINKEKGMTSHDVVNRLRRILKTKKIGHCGTLDPEATGLLVICIGKATKALQFLMSDNKEYNAKLSLGISTDTYDHMGKTVETKEFTGIDTDLNTVINSFIGEIEQVPPIYSAIKVNGKKLYEYARNGQEVEIKPRKITIHDIKILSEKDNIIALNVKCSKGTYIRSLCFDIAKALDYPGHMCELNRVSSGNFNLTDAYTLEDVENGKYKLYSIDEALDSFRKVIVDDENIVYHGKLIKNDGQGQFAICNKEGHILAIYQSDGNGYLKNVRGLW